MFKIQKFLILIIFTVILFSASINAAEISFTDINSNDWFYEDVIKLAGDGIINGYEDGTYRPDDSITCAEFTKLLVTSLNLATSDAPEGSHWSEKYRAAAVENGIVSENDSEYEADTPITRLYVAKIIVRGLKLDTARIDNPFSDVNDEYVNTAYNEYILSGYKADDGTYTYNGNDNITRAEAAAVILRVQSYTADSYEYRKSKIFNLAENGVINNEGQLADLFMIVNHELYKTFRFKSDIDKELILDIYERTQLSNPETFYGNGIEYVYTVGSNLYEFTITYDYDIERIREMRDADIASVNTIATEIFKDGMSDKDKVKAAHDYIILNCQYDYQNSLNGTLTLESYSAYGVFTNKKAVCEGYAAAFNMLCRQAGIPCIAISGNSSEGASGSNHMWNMLLIDDNILYVDATFDDPIPDRAGSVQYTYFLLTDSELSALGHSWDKAQSNIKYFF